MKKILYIFVLFSNTILAQKNNAEDSLYIENRIHEAFKSFHKVDKYGLGFIRYYPTGEYSSTGATFKIFNPSKKTIKYIWFTVAGENPVGDLVMNGKSYYKTLKAIGPIKPKGIGEWNFDYVWFTDIVETLRISTIKVQYMDLSIKTIKYNENMYIGQDAYDELISALNKEADFIENESKKTVLPDDYSVYLEVDQAPEFPGGTTFLKSNFNTNFDQINTVTFPTGIYKTEINFIVEKDGSISDIQATGSNEIFNTESISIMKSLKKRWIPAKISSIPVRYRYKLPITKNFD